MTLKRNLSKFTLSKYAIILYCAAISFLLLLICSRSSFLYPYNDWNDANSYFSVGKAIFNGKIPYRDVFDQKGFYLYFLYGIAYLISNTSFIGVFLLEVLLSTFFLFGAYKILTLYVKNKTACLLLPLFGTVTLSSYSFYWGGSAEEICLPFYMWGLYLSLRYFKEEYPNPIKRSTVLTGGILAGIVAMIKFTGLGFFFAWMLTIALSFLLRKDLIGMMKSCLTFLTAMILACLPGILYFALNNALYDMYWGYIYINVFVYSDLNTEGPTLFERIYTLSKLLYWTSLNNIRYFTFTILGVTAMTFSPKTKWLEKINLLLLCFFLFLGIYIGGSELPYYALPLCIFAISGFACIGQIAEKILTRTARPLPHPAIPPILTTLSILTSLLFAYHFSMNTYFMHTKKEDHFLYQFQQIIAETPQPTLLNIGCLDAGLYTVCDIVPTCRWFQTQTLRIDEVDNAQLQYIAQGQTDYILARDTYPNIIHDRYDLIAQAPFHWDGTEFTYYLFRKIPQI